MRDHDPWKEFRAVVQRDDEEETRRYFEALFKSVREELVRFATWCIGQHNAGLLPAHVLDAPGIAADAFTELYFRRHTIREDPHHWILGTIKRIVRFRVSKAWREIKSEKEVRWQLTRWQRPLKRQSSISPEDRHHIRAALGSLSPRLRTVVLLLYFRDESVATTAQRLKITPNAVIQARRRALKLIRGLLEKMRGGQ